MAQRSGLRSHEALRTQRHTEPLRFQPDEATEDEALEAADRLIRNVPEAAREKLKRDTANSEANRRVQELVAEKGMWIAPHLWSGLTRFRPGAGIAVVGDPEQCAATLQQFVDAGADRMASMFKGGRTRHHVSPGETAAKMMERAATKLADGSIDNTEFQNLDGLDQTLATTDNVTFNNRLVTYIFLLL